MNKIFRQPNGKFMVTCPKTNTITLFDCDREEIIQEFIDSEAQRIRNEANRIMDVLEKGINPYQHPQNYAYILYEHCQNAFRSDDAETKESVALEVERFSLEHPAIWERTKSYYEYKKSLIQNGTSVITKRTEIPTSDWTEEAIAARRFGVRGIVIQHHDSHGLCYKVRHEDDETIGCYEPEELEVIS